MENGTTHVNPHYLDKVLQLSSSADVEAGEDIYSAKGVKLLSKGSRLDPSVQERLIRHKLAKPLESSIALAGGFSDECLQRGMDHVLGADGIGPLLGEPAIAAVRAVFQRLQLRRSGLDLVLSLLQQSGDEDVHVMLTACCMSIRLGLELRVGEAELEQLALAGLLHQVGYLYLDPLLRHRDAPRNLPVWRQLIAQPLIAGMALGHVPGLPAATVQAVREQYERLDGSGYPVGVNGRALGPLSQTVAAAVLAAHLLHQHGQSGLWQTRIAMQLVAGEFAGDVISAVLRLVQASPAMQPAADADQAALLPPLFAHIAELQNGLEELEDRFTASSKEANIWLRRTTQRLYTIQRTFSTTGIDALAAGARVDSPEVRTELLLICREIRRRLHELGKTALLQLPALDTGLQQAATPWLENLLND